MKPIAIDFCPPPATPPRAHWMAWGAGMLAIVVAWAWLLTPAVEASLPGEPVRVRAMAPADEAAAVDAAVRELNWPWIAALDAVSTALAATPGLRATRIDGDIASGSLRVAGEARDAVRVLGLPAALRELPGVAEARLVGQEPRQGDSGWDIQFVLEIRVREHS